VAANLAGEVEAGLSVAAYHLPWAPLIADTPFMAGTAADTPTTPEFVRVSDVDRDRAVDGLRREFVDGRLSQETFMLRMQAALNARNHGQLSGLFTDLPSRVSFLGRARDALRQWRAGMRERQPEADPGYGWERGRAPAVPEPERVPRPLLFPPGTDTSFTIGRDKQCDLYLGDMTVSRVHARLTRVADGWQLTDLSSSNGTRVNGWRLRAAVPVRPGDTITFGSAVFVLQPDGQPDGQPGGQPDGQAGWQPGGQPDGQAGAGYPGHLEG
jgi:hypothetical protein